MRPRHKHFAAGYSSSSSSELSSDEESDLSGSDFDDDHDKYFPKNSSRAGFCSCLFGGNSNKGYSHKKHKKHKKHSKHTRSTPDVGGLGSRDCEAIAQYFNDLLKEASSMLHMNNTAKVFKHALPTQISDDTFSFILLVTNVTEDHSKWREFIQNRAGNVENYLDGFLLKEFVITRSQFTESLANESNDHDESEELRGYTKFVMMLKYDDSDEMRRRHKSRHKKKRAGTTGCINGKMLCVVFTVPIAIFMFVFPIYTTYKYYTS